MRKQTIRRKFATHPRWARCLLDLPFVGVAICDPLNFQWLYANDRIRAMLGYEAAELARMGWRELCHPGDRAACEDALKRALVLPTERVRAVLRLRHRDASVVRADVDLSVAQPRAAGGKYVIALIADTPVQPAAAAAAREAAEPAVTEASKSGAEETLQALVEQSITGIYIIEDGRYSFVNPRMAQIFGYSSAELTGIEALETVAPEDRDVAAENIRRRLAGEVGSLQFEFRALRKDGTRFDVGAHGNVAVIRGKRVIVGVLQDITERVKSERHVKEHLHRLQAAMFATVDTISRIVDLRDPYTAGHEKRVARISAAIARALGIESERIRGLEIAGRVHDIGKLGVPAEILAKPTRLSAAEFQLVREHAQNGKEILNGIEFPWPVAEVAFQHHERMDGSGYPQGLKGADISDEARILAVADVIEAIASHRPYRASLGIEVALVEIERGAGRIYDADVCRSALKLFREKKFTISD